jgi:ABC-type sugar transport system permease subunit
MRGKRIKRKIHCFVFAAPYFLTYLLFSLVPVVFTLCLSFVNWDGFSEMIFVGLGNYKRMILDMNFWKSVWNTIILAFVGFSLTSFIALLMAYFLQSKMLVGSKFFQFVNFYPYICTPVAIGLIWSILFDWGYGTFNKILMTIGIIQEPIYWLGDPLLAKIVVITMGVWKYSGYTMMFIVSAITAVDPEMLESAYVDGASRLQTYIRITLPAIRNVLIFIYLTSIIGGLQMFDEPMLLFRGGFSGSQPVGGPGKSVLTMIINLYSTTYTNGQLGYGAAISFGIFVVIAMFSFINLKYLMRGDK